MCEKLDFYLINKDYLNYLNKIDSKVPKTKETVASKKYKFDKFYIGVVLNINGISYFAPVSSNTKKLKTSINIKNNKGEFISSIRFSFMIPVDNNQLQILDIDNIYKDIKYQKLVWQELKYCIKHKDEIYQKANYVYNLRKWNNKLSNLCCDFKKLEKACSLYRYFKEFNEYAKQKYNTIFEDMKLDIVEDELKIIYNNSEIMIDGETEKEILARHLILPFESRDDYLEYDRKLDLNDKIDSKSLEGEIEI